MTTTNTKRLTFIAILSALSFVLMYFSFPLIPGASFLKFDFSIIPMLLALMIYDFRASLVVLVVRSLLKLLLNSQGVETYIGLPMNIVALGLFLLAFALVWKKRQTLASFLQAGAVATVLLTIAMVVLNLIYAVPLYAAFANFDIEKMIGVARYIFAMVIPFNLLEGVVLSAVFYLVQLSVKPVVERYIS